MRVIPLVILVGVLIAGWFLGLPQLISWQALADNQARLHAAVADNPGAAMAWFIGLYAFAAAVSTPGSFMISVASGVLFGTWLGAACSLVGATLGAIVLFLVVRSALADFVARRAHRVMARVGPALERDGFLYLLALRLTTVVPFWLVTIVSALAGLRLLPFAGATLLGIIPATVIFASVGAGMDALIAGGARPDASVLLSPPILLPLLGLALLSMLPIAWRTLRPATGARLP
jgi:uncharacterized membrane protein YdjX (TVP38/TMEM64 family)